MKPRLLLTTPLLVFALACSSSSGGASNPNALWCQELACCESSALSATENQEIAEEVAAGDEMACFSTLTLLEDSNGCSSEAFARCENSP